MIKTAILQNLTSKPNFLKTCKIKEVLNVYTNIKKLLMRENIEEKNEFLIKPPISINFRLQLAFIEDAGYFSSCADSKEHLGKF